MKDGQVVTKLLEVASESARGNVSLELSFASTSHRGPVTRLRLTIDAYDVASLTLTPDQSVELATALLMAHTALRAERAAR